MWFTLGPSEQDKAVATSSPALKPSTRRRLGLVTPVTVTDALPS